MNIFLDSKMDENRRRQELYRGSVLVYSPSPSATKLCEFARELIEAAFHPHNPLKIHETLPVEECVKILADLKPKFIHHPVSKQLIQGMLTERGCDLEKTYFDVPRLRTAFPSDYLTSGIATFGTPRRSRKLIGGCRSTKSIRKIAWPSIPVIGTSACPTIPIPTITTSGTAPAAKTPRNTSRPIPASSLALRLHSLPIRKSA